ncbi:hypothetical protein CF319_g9036 [Tilletia indica]|nr:hypothetical protein CF319_g9036 [Tilletia indica]
MTIGIGPVVSERKVQWGMVTRLIEGRIRELKQGSGDTDGNVTSSEAGAAPDLRSKSSQFSISADESGRSAASIPEETDDEESEDDQEKTDTESSLVAEPGPQERNRQSPSMLNFDDEIDRTSTPVSGARPAVETSRAKEAMAQSRNEALRSQRDFPSQDAVERVTGYSSAVAAGEPRRGSSNIDLGPAGFGNSLSRQWTYDPFAIFNADFGDRAEQKVFPQA